MIFRSGFSRGFTGFDELVTVLGRDMTVRFNTNRGVVNNKKEFKKCIIGNVNLTMTFKNICLLKIPNFDFKSND